LSCDFLLPLSTKSFLDTVYYRKTDVTHLLTTCSPDGNVCNVY
jgi:hypothetical protein